MVACRRRKNVLVISINHHVNDEPTSDASPFDFMRGKTQYGTSVMLGIFIVIFFSITIIPTRSPYFPQLTQNCSTKTKLDKNLIPTATASIASQSYTGSNFIQSQAPRRHADTHQHRRSPESCPAIVQETCEATDHLGVSLADIQMENLHMISNSAPLGGPIDLLADACSHTGADAMHTFCAAIPKLFTCTTLNCYETFATEIGGCSSFVTWGLRPVPFDRQRDALTITIVEPLENAVAQRLDVYLELLLTCGDAGNYLSEVAPELPRFIERVQEIAGASIARANMVSMAGYCLRLDGSRGPIKSDILDGDPAASLAPPASWREAWSFDDWDATWLQDRRGISELSDLLDESPELGALYTAVRTLNELHVPMLWSYAQVRGFASEMQEHHERACRSFAYDALPLRLSDLLPYNFDLHEKWRSTVVEIFETVRSSHLVLLGNGTSPYARRAREKLKTVELIFGGMSSPWTLDSAPLFLQTLQKSRSVIEVRRALRLHAIGSLKPYSLKNGRRMEPLYSPGRFEANAEYRALDNSLVFNIGLLGYLEHFSTSLERMATVGFVIGHELSHSMDPNGMWFAADGTPCAVGTVHDARESQRTFRCYVELGALYGQDGFQTLNENFADGKGLRAALHASNVDSPESFDTFARTFASLWCNLGFEIGDSHAPGRVRAQMSLESIGDLRGRFPHGVTCAQNVWRCDR